MSVVDPAISASVDASDKVSGASQITNDQRAAIGLAMLSRWLQWPRSMPLDEETIAAGISCLLHTAHKHTLDIPAILKGAWGNYTNHR
jgi:hypothetical protein